MLYGSFFEEGFGDIMHKFGSLVKLKCYIKHTIGLGIVLGKDLRRSRFGEGPVVWRVHWDNGRDTWELSESLMLVVEADDCLK
jgi:hypothetical protein